MGDADRPERAIDVERGEQQKQRDGEDDVGDDQRQERERYQQLLAAKAVARYQDGDHRRQDGGDQAASCRHQHAVARRRQRRGRGQGIAVPLQRNPLQGKGQDLIGIERKEDQDRDRQVEQGDQHQVVAP